MYKNEDVLFCVQLLLNDLVSKEVIEVSPMGYNKLSSSFVFEKEKNVHHLLKYLDGLISSRVKSGLGTLKEMGLYWDRLTKRIIYRLTDVTDTQHFIRGENLPVTKDLYGNFAVDLKKLEAVDFSSIAEECNLSEADYKVFASVCLMLNEYTLVFRGIYRIVTPELPTHEVDELSRIVFNEETSEALIKNNYSTRMALVGRQDLRRAYIGLGFTYMTYIESLMLSNDIENKVYPLVVKINNNRL